ncbi:MAG: histidinol dehydrogenase [Armatimonadetes bacterium]|nr:histidinol dehydrogenase [Armatimonadota bacterium]
MKILETDRDPADEILAALRPETIGPSASLRETVSGIISDVKTRGDQALLELGRKFDSPNLQSLRAADEDFKEAYDTIKPELLQAIRTAKANIEEFHRKQIQKSWIDMHEDFVYGQVVRPIEKVGFYAPGGLAPYPSTVLMTAIPGMVAGVSKMVMCAPAQADGKIHGPMLVAARECGVNDVFKVGGAQAVAAMAYGTATVPSVDKIVGPGNAYVTEAKRQVFGIVGIDQLAGPSEILVIADETANPAYVAADLLSQAEHAEDSRCALVTNSRRMADAVLKEVRARTESALRKDLIRNSLDTYGAIVIARDLDECAELANAFAPEHLEIATADPWEVLRKIKNAGTVMLGHYTPVPLCDYAAGPNHTLPTSGTSRFSSALSVDDFIKKSGLLSYTESALKRIAPTVTEIAACEGFEAHANTITIRLENEGR